MFNLQEFLAMSEEEQEDWIRENARPYLVRESLADLAFRLRDEAVKVNRWRYSEIIRDICKIVNEPKADNCGCFDAAMWLENEGKPIHWIAAALEAKRKRKAMQEI